MFYRLSILFLVGVFLSCNQTNNQQTRSTQDHVSLVKYASGFNLVRNENYSLITIFDPWNKASTVSTILVKKPEKLNQDYNYPEADLIINKNLNRVMTQSTTNAVFFSLLNEQNKVAGACDAHFFCDTILYKRYKNGSLENIGRANNLNPEIIIQKSPDLLVKYIYKTIEESDKKITGAGIPILYLTDYMEEHPLGRAEWVKVVGALLNKNQMADSIFRQIEENYNSLKYSIDSIKSRPSVMVGSSFKGTWYVPAGNSFLANLISDAGGEYYFKNDTNAGSLTISFEAILENQQTADVWINANASSLKEIEATDSRLKVFKALQKGNVYHFDKLKNPEGGIGYFELGVARPDLLLSDLVNIFHNDNVEITDQTIFWRKLE